MKASLVGSIRKIPKHQISTKNFNKQIDKKVQSTLEWSKAITHCACSQCGTVKEIDHNHSVKLLALAKKSPTLIEEIKRYYFLVSFCEYCKELPVKVSLVPKQPKKTA